MSILEHAGSMETGSISSSSVEVNNDPAHCNCERNDIPISARICKLPAWMHKAWILGQIGDGDEPDLHSLVRFTFKAALESSLSTMILADS